MKQFHPRSWLQAIPPSAPCDHMSEAPTGTYVEAQEANEIIADLRAEVELLRREKEASWDSAEYNARRAAKRERELVALRDELERMLPKACCEGGNPNCYGPRGCLLRAMEADSTPRDKLVERAEKAEAREAKLREALRNLAQATHDYRLTHDSNGGAHIETGRAWDRMRRAEQAALNETGGE